MDNEEMKVIKRSGEYEDISFDKILKRIKSIGLESNIQINYTSLAIKIIDQLYDNISTTLIDELTAQTCASLSTIHPDYSLLSSRIIISNLHKNTQEDYHVVIGKLYEKKLITKSLYEIVDKNKELIQSWIDYSRDYLFDYFGYKTLEKAYLFKINDKVIERPQHLWLRVALGIHGEDLESAKETYFYMSNKYFIHATPTLYNAGTYKCQLSSCYLISIEEDSLEGIYNTLKDCALISKWSGGIGLHIHNVRGKGSRIKQINGTSNGIVPMLRVFNNTARYIDQGGKRNGSFAIYLEPWHIDIETFLELKKNHGDEELKARDLFYGLWICDLFMKRVEKNEKWTLFCPNDLEINLSELYGDEFDEKYIYYESKNIGKEINARELWYKILDTQMETGTPYLLYKDSINKKSNQKNLGVIKSSNLCCEIVEYSDKDETAVCNLASIGLPRFVDKKTKTFNFEKLQEIVKIITRNLNKIIDINFYPTEKTKRSNMLHRPIGIGVQGLADTFLLLDFAFESKEAKDLNKKIFECIYYTSLYESNQIAISRQENVIKINNFIESSFLNIKVNKLDNYKHVLEILKQYVDNIYIPTHIFKILTENNILWNELIQLKESCKGAYSSFVNSPLSQGLFQFDLWDEKIELSQDYDWDELRECIKTYGTRNSLLIAPMPTASTSQILGYNECFEPITSNIYTRRTLAGEFIVINKYLINELIELNIWNESVKNNIIENKGSIQQLTFLPKEILEKYKIVWEIPMKTIIDMSIDRGKFIDQSQSLNLWLEDPNYQNLTSMHFYSWKKGLKTGIYYLRRKAKHQAQQFTIEPTQACEMCSA
jgi:ribonucleoside-diphosphate reductase subunit M1